MDTQDNLNHLELDDDCSADKLVFNLDFNAELSDVSNTAFSSVAIFRNRFCNSVNSILHVEHSQSVTGTAGSTRSRRPIPFN